jgi:hypothetical protein
MGVMDAMCYDPLDVAPFQRECAADGQKIFHYLWRLVTTMRQESVKTHADPQTRGNPPEHDRYHHRSPTKHKECSHGAHMK